MSVDNIFHVFADVKISQGIVMKYINVINGPLSEVLLRGRGYSSCL